MSTQRMLTLLVYPVVQAVVFGVGLIILLETRAEQVGAALWVLGSLALSLPIAAFVAARLLGPPRTPAIVVPLTRRPPTDAPTMSSAGGGAVILAFRPRRPAPETH